MMVDDRHHWAEEVTARLVILRHWLELSQGEMAALLGMSARAYREWERPGRRKWTNINQSPAPILVDVTGVSLDWLFCGRYADGPPSRVPLAARGKRVLPMMSLH